MILIAVPTAVSNLQNLFDVFASLVRNTKEEYNLIFIKNNYTGFAKAINNGFFIVKNDENYDGIIILNDDVTICNEDWLNKMLEKRNELDIIGCKNTYRNNHVPFWCTYISRKVIDRIGYLDEHFILGEWEDVDYCVRAIDEDFNVGECEAEAYHKIHGTIGLLKKDENALKLIENNKNIFLNKYKGTKWEKIFS